MKKAFRLTALLLALLMLSGCRLTELIRKKDLHLSDVFESVPTPTPAPTPVPTEKPAPELEGAALEVRNFLTAVRDGERETVRGYCGDGIPGYNTAVPSSSSLVRMLYDTVYGRLEFKIGIVSETPLSATVATELTTLDMRSVLDSLSDELNALRLSGEWDAMSDADRTDRAGSLLISLLAQCKETSTKKVTVFLAFEDDRWVIQPSADLCAGLSGSLTTALPEFDLPTVHTAGIVMADPDRSGMGVYMYGDANTGSFLITGIYPNDPEGYVITARTENYRRTELVYSLRNVMVNGYLIDPGWNGFVPAGGTAEHRIVWDRSKLALCGIDSVETVTFDLDAFERPAWPVYPAATTHTGIRPGGTRSGSSPREGQNEQVLVDDGSTVFSILSSRSLGCWGYELTVYMENNTADELWFSFGEEFINGLPLDPGWSEAIPAGGRAVETLRWSAGSLLGNAVGEVENVDFHLYISTLLGLDERESGYSAGGHFVRSEAE